MHLSEQSNIATWCVKRTLLALVFEIESGIAIEIQKL
jgi:hypothetical protein